MITTLAHLIGPLAVVYSLIEQNRARAVLDKGKVEVLFAAKFQSVYKNMRRDIL